jgi:hypothetical protein
MPQLQISLPGAPSGLKVKWRMENRYPRRNGRDDIDFPNSDQNPYKVLPANQPWNIYSEYANPEKFFAGDCTIFMTILDGNENPISSEQQLKFRIRGKNPEDQRGLALILDICLIRGGITNLGRERQFPRWRCWSGSYF